MSIQNMLKSPFNFVVPGFIRDALSKKDSAGKSSVSQSQENEDNAASSKNIIDKQNDSQPGDVSDSDESSVSVSTSGVSSLIPHAQKDRPSCHTNASNHLVTNQLQNSLKRVQESPPNYSHKRLCSDKTLTPSQILFGISNYKRYHNTLRHRDTSLDKKGCSSPHAVSNASKSSVFDPLENSDFRNSQLKTTLKDIYRNMEKFNSSSYLYSSYSPNPYVFKKGNHSQSTPPTSSHQLCPTRAKISYQPLSHHSSLSSSTLSRKRTAKHNGGVNENLPVKVSFLESQPNHCSTGSQSRNSKSDSVTSNTPTINIKDSSNESSVHSKIVSADECDDVAKPILQSPTLTFNFSKPLSASASSARLKQSVGSTVCSSGSSSTLNEKKCNVVTTGTSTNLCDLQRQDTLLLYENGATKEDIKKWLDSTKDASISTPKLRTATGSVYSDDDYPSGKSLKLHSNGNIIGIRSSPSKLRLWRCETCLLENPLTVLICPSCNTPKRLHTFSRCRMNRSAYTAPVRPSDNEPQPQTTSESELKKVDSSESKTVSFIQPSTGPPMMNSSSNEPVPSTTSTSSNSNQLLKSVLFSANKPDDDLKENAPAIPISTSISDTSPIVSLPSGGFSFPSISTLERPIASSSSASATTVCLSQNVSNFPSIGSSSPFSNQNLVSNSFPSIPPVINISSGLSFPSANEPPQQTAFPSPFSLSSTASSTFPSLPQMSSSTNQSIPESSQPAAMKPFFNFSSTPVSLNFHTTSTSSSSAATPITSSQSMTAPLFQFGSNKTTPSLLSQQPLAPAPSAFSTPAPSLFPSTGSVAPQRSSLMESGEQPPSAKMPAFSFGVAKPPAPANAAFNFGNSQSAPHLPALVNNPSDTAALPPQVNVFSATGPMNSRNIKRAKRRMKPNQN